MATDLAVITRVVLQVLRPKVARAFIDGISDNPWPAHLSGRVRQVLELGAEAKLAGRSTGSDPTTGIEIDVTDDAQFELFVEMAPYAMHSEAWQMAANGEHQLFSVADSGAHAYFVLDQNEKNKVDVTLAANDVGDAYEEL